MVKQTIDKAHKIQDFNRKALKINRFIKAFESGRSLSLRKRKLNPAENSENAPSIEAKKGEKTKQSHAEDTWVS